MPPENEIIQRGEPLPLQLPEEVGYAEKFRIENKIELKKFILENKDKVRIEGWRELCDLVEQYCDINVVDLENDELIERERNLFSKIEEKSKGIYEIASQQYDVFLNNSIGQDNTITNDNIQQRIDENINQEQETALHSQLSGAAFLMSWFEGRGDGYGDFLKNDVNEKVKKDNIYVVHDEDFSLEKDVSFRKVEDEPGVGAPLFPHDPCMEDIKQGQLGDCYMLSGLGAIANFNPEKIKEGMRDNKDGTVTVRFFKNKDGNGVNFTGGEPFYVTVDKTVPQKPKRGQMTDSYNHKSLWVQMLEKAYAASGMQVQKENNNGLKKESFKQPVPHNINSEIYVQCARELGKMMADQFMQGKQKTSFLESYNNPQFVPKVNDMKKAILESSEQNKSAFKNTVERKWNEYKAKYPWIFDNQDNLKRWKPSYGHIQGDKEIGPIMGIFMGTTMPIVDNYTNLEYLRWQDGTGNDYMKEVPDEIKELEKKAGEYDFTNGDSLEKFGKLAIKYFNAPLDVDHNTYALINIHTGDLIYEVLNSNTEFEKNDRDQLEKYMNHFDKNEREISKFDPNNHRNVINIIKKYLDKENALKEQNPETKTPIGKAMESFKAAINDGAKNLAHNVTKNVKNGILWTKDIKTHFTDEMIKKQFENALNNKVNGALNNPKTEINDYNRMVKVKTFFERHKFDSLYVPAMAYFLHNNKLPSVDNYGNILPKNGMEDMVKYFNEYREGYIKVCTLKSDPPKLSFSRSVGIINKNSNDFVDPNSVFLGEFFEDNILDLSKEPNSQKQKMGEYTEEDLEVYEQLHYLTNPEEGRGRFAVTGGVRHLAHHSDPEFRALPGGHAYSILGVKERMINGKTYKFVQIRNPHSREAKEYFVNKNGELEGRRMDIEKGKQYKGFFEIELTEFRKTFQQIAVTGGPTYSKMMGNVAKTDGTSKQLAEYQNILNQFCETLASTNHGIRWDTDAYKKMIKETDRLRREFLKPETRSLSSDQLAEKFNTLENLANVYFTTHANRKRNERMDVRFQTSDAIMRLCKIAKNPELCKNPQKAFRDELAEQVGDKIIEGYAMQQKGFDFSKRQQFIAQHSNSAKKIMNLDNVKMTIGDYTQEELFSMVTRKSQSELTNIMLGSQYICNEIPKKKVIGATVGKKKEVVQNDLNMGI